MTHLRLLLSLCSFLFKPIIQYPSQKISHDDHTDKFNADWTRNVAKQEKSKSLPYDMLRMMLGE